MINLEKLKKKYFNFHALNKQQQTLIIDSIFTSVAQKYDIMNDLMSLGLHRFWKYITIQYSKAYHGQTILDLASGTGDLATQLAYLVGEKGKVILVDINTSMLEEGRKKLRNKGIISNVYYIQSNAEKLPFQNNIFDCIIIAFGLRNIVDKESALTSMQRVLKPGGKLLILEFSIPKFKFQFLHTIYDWYSFYIIPKIGKVITKNADSYYYLVESIRMYPNPEKIKMLMLDAGFQNVEYFYITQGIVTLHSGYKLETK